MDPEGHPIIWEPCLSNALVHWKRSGQRRSTGGSAIAELPVEQYVLWDCIPQNNIIGNPYSFFLNYDKQSQTPDKWRNNLGLLSKEFY
jgi:hypothetical protein